MTYSSASDVALYCPEVIGDGSSFSDITEPTVTQVQRFQDMAYSRINTALAAKGYSTPVGSTATVYDELVDLEAVFAAARVQMSRMSSRLGPNERSKSQVLMKDFDDRLKVLVARDLSRAGVGATTKLYAGGISKSDKTDVEGDTDRVTPRFKAGQFDYPGSQKPNGSGATEQS